ncbi:MAG: Integrase core domain protein [Candidatus Atribacteria bacterium ADurb.Bin276]|uniref:Integrase core domain protein n=1 Tax=Candidatus Atribacter allofermentans TaxID=1852833 RepID=A0A1V5ST34_9BACT|nr:MAG: Integrase core domain protein [Candidatus Atribacteria bacterium ADurb.Bin276]
MPWMEVHKVDLRRELIYRYLNKEKVTDLCREYGISRKTAYKYIHRFQAFGLDGLKDQSRCPLYLASKTDALTEQMILDTKLKHPSWGAKKIKPFLEEEHPYIAFPVVSTISAILSRHGLVRSHPRRLKRSVSPHQLRISHEPNEIWCVDFKGQFQTRDQKDCYPLTITDHYSRYLLACEALSSPSIQESLPVFKECFSKYGLPQVIRSDNGTPFASLSAPFGLTHLAVWLVKLGIILERIDLGHPEQNSRHERMHRTLKEEACFPPASNLFTQQDRFEVFKKTYNTVRPHEALGQKTPASWYHKSDRPYPKTLSDCEYPHHTLTRKVDSSGRISLNGNHQVRISKVFTGEFLGFKDYNDSWLVSFSQYDIGTIDKETHTFESLEYQNA